VIPIASHRGPLFHQREQDGIELARVELRVVAVPQEELASDELPLVGCPLVDESGGTVGRVE
jgi:hypothetical protein